MTPDPDTYDYVSRIIHKLARNDSEHDDLVQEVFIKALTSKGYRGKCSKKTWLYTLARQAVVDKWRYRNMECRAGIHVELDWEALNEHLDERDISAGLEVEGMLAQVDKLGKTNGEIFRQYYIQGLEMKDIAKARRMTVDAVKDRIRRMRDELNDNKRVRRKAG